MIKFLAYKDARDFLEKTGKTIEEGLATVEAELQRLKQGKK